MMSEALRKAREFEETYEVCVPETERPVFHAAPRIGWMNDPNGFSFYRGEYHLFYQYNPYSTHWDTMHWGHLKTKDFIRWERLPAALAPDSEYDRDGCFSGSAVELPDGRQLLMYTGIRRERESDGIEREHQTQCLAIGDGRNYEKYEGNPVLKEEDLPAGGKTFDFRDPKLWREQDGTYHAVIVTRMEDESGAVLLYRSADGFSWKFERILDRCRNEYGKMWECPDCFSLDGRQVLLVSPMEMRPSGLEFHAGHGTICLIGRHNDENGAFLRENVYSVDYGLDFYAAQTLETPDGRRVMIAWMQNWTNANCQPQNIRHYGEMTVPRELTVRDNRLIQNPVRELERYHRDAVLYRDIPVTEEITLDGVRGRILDMTLSIRPAAESGYHWFKVCVAKDGEHMTTVQYKPDCSVVRIDRSRCGAPYDIVHVRDFPVRRRAGKLKLRLIMDRHSLEVFVNDGEQAASLLLYTPESADAFSFEANGGTVMLDVEKYGLDITEHQFPSFKRL